MMNDEIEEGKDDVMVRKGNFKICNLTGKAVLTDEMLSSN